MKSLTDTSNVLFLKIWFLRNDISQRMTNHAQINIDIITNDEAEPSHELWYECWFANSWVVKFLFLKTTFSEISFQYFYIKSWTMVNFKKFAKFLGTFSAAVLFLLMNVQWGRNWGESCYSSKFLDCTYIFVAKNLWFQISFKYYISPPLKNFIPPSLWMCNRIHAVGINMKSKKWKMKST